VERVTLRKVLGEIPYGIVVVGGSSAGSIYTMVATWVTQVSFTPPMVALALERGSTMRTMAESSGFFSLNLLPAGREGMEMARDFLKFSGVRGELLNGHPYSLAPNGTPYLGEAIGSVECRVASSLETGDHFLVVGEVVDVVFRREGRALTLRETGWKYQR
jgi:flavin reductase (DIM6/NTAB) family NADH-FMN oxidoreductase RutF